MQCVCLMLQTCERSSLSARDVACPGVISAGPRNCTSTRSIAVPHRGYRARRELRSLQELRLVEIGFCGRAY
jgi:hypothetical protein